MSDTTFSCPTCGQHIQCDEQWGGQTIACPACQTQLIVPQAEAAPAAPPPPRRPSPAPGPRYAPAPVPTFDQPKSSKATKVIVYSLVTVALGVGLYFGYGLVSSWQDKINEKSRRAGGNSSGGGTEMEHISELYQVLDATDTVRNDSPSPGRMDSDDGDSAAVRLAMARLHEAPPAPEYSLPVMPAVWTLDVDAARITDGRANGMIAGTNFVVEAGRLDKTSQGFVLSLRQGKGPVPDREMLVYLRLNAGEALAGRTWTISKEMSGAKVPQVVKRWRPNPKYAPQQKLFGLGYAMKLELGQPDEETLPGQIFLALPDAEQSVVAGKFRLTLPPEPEPAMPVGFGGDDD